jgi:NAD(P)H-dependent FMN reductase
VKFVIISGSHRKSSQSEKVSQFFKGRLGLLAKDSEVSVLSLAANPLPLWDDIAPDQSDQWRKIWEPFSKELSEADAFVFVVPEWSGMVPPGFKNLLLLAAKELAHKPALLATVSSAIGGSYPIAELRMSGYKNTHISYLPEHLIIHWVEEVLNGDTINSARAEAELRDRIDYSLKLLKVYAEAYQIIRNTKEVDLSSYPYGM